MNELKRKTNVNRALQVIQRTQEGLTITEACNELGMPRSSYYFIIQSEREALAEIQGMIFTSSIGNLEKILKNQTMVLEQIIEDGISERTKPKDRIAIYKALVELRDELFQSIKKISDTNSNANGDFTGPLLRDGKSTFQVNNILDE